MQVSIHIFHGPAFVARPGKHCAVRRRWPIYLRRLLVLERMRPAMTAGLQAHETRGQIRRRRACDVRHTGREDMTPSASRLTSCGQENDMAFSMLATCTDRSLIPPCQSTSPFAWADGEATRRARSRPAWDGRSSRRSDLSLLVVQACPATLPQ